MITNEWKGACVAILSFAAIATLTGGVGARQIDAGCPHRRAPALPEAEKSSAPPLTNNSSRLAKWPMTMTHSSSASH